MDQIGEHKDIIISTVVSTGFVFCALLLSPIVLIMVFWCVIWYKKYNCSYSCWKVEESSEMERNSNSSTFGSIDRDITDIDVPKYDELSIQDELPSYLQVCHVYENECKETRVTAVWV